MVLVALFAFVVLRGLTRAGGLQDDFTRLAVSRIVAADRFPVLHQHRRQSRIAAGQGHDAAAGLLWRFVDDRGCDHGGLPAGVDPAQAGKPGATEAFLPGGREVWRRSRSWRKGKLFLLSAGGTGGHLFPAQALAHELVARGHRVHLVTDSRAERFAGKFPASEVHIVRSATIGSKNPIKLIKALWTLFSGVREAGALIRKMIRPDAVIGFGGYPTIPPLLAASNAALPTMIHEQNAVMGRANKALASRVKAIAGGFLPEGRGAHAAKTVITGNPVRPEVLAAAAIPYTPSRMVRSGWLCSAAARARSSSPMPFLQRSRCCPIRLRARLELTCNRPGPRTRSRSARAFRAWRQG
jgi:hypothetical protein